MQHAVIQDIPPLFLQLLLLSNLSKLLSLMSSSTVPMNSLKITSPSPNHLNTSMTMMMMFPILTLPLILPFEVIELVHNFVELDDVAELVDALSWSNCHCCP